MGWKFQKRIRLLPGVTINLSRKGISTSLGTTGARVTLGHGKRRTTLGIPGSGISHTDVVPTKTARRSARAGIPAPQGRGGRWLKLLLISVAIFIVALLAGLKAAWAVNKCTGADGKVSFQDAPCAGNGEQIDVRPASGPARAAAPAATPQPPIPKVSAPVPPPAAPAVPVQPAPVATKSPIEREADECLAWYRPKLRDPAGAYYTAPSKDRRTLSITIHATNGYGGYVTQRASCDFINGKFDASWTKIRAKDGGW